VPTVEIAVDDPNAEDVHELLRRHLEFAEANTPPEEIHALAVGALKQLDGRHAELKSMHTAAAARGRGIGRAMVEHLIGVARDHGFGRVSLETGSTPAFAPARSLYGQAGFTPCGPFGDYLPGRGNTFMTLAL
jgi:putative acetyltransferase